MSTTENLDSGTRFYGPDITDAELAAWDDVTGLELSEHIADDLIVSPPWLSSLFYSDYADAGDDEDRAEMNIPRAIIDSL